MLPDFELLNAIRHGNVRDMELAIASGADINCRDLNDLTALGVAERYHQNDLVERLVAHGADVDAPIGEQGNRLLHKAARNSNLGFTDALLSNGADVNATNNAGQTPLYIAVRHGHEYVARLLLKSGANINAIDPRTGNTPLHLAAKAGDKAMINLLLSQGAAAFARNKTGYTPMHEAAAAGQTEAVKLFMDRCYLSPSERMQLMPRVRLAAELHGHNDTAASILAAEGTGQRSFADQVCEERLKVARHR